MVRCYIITPASDPPGYSEGHVKRVYDFVLMPACRAAGYLPLRAGETVYQDSMDVVKELIDCEVVICDISANNTHALYGLAVRQALGLPVVVVKDNKSVVTFDPTEMNIVEYDESLRIDTVQREVEAIGEALTKAVENKKEKYELLYRLNIGVPPVEVPPTEVVSAEPVTTGTEDTNDAAEEPHSHAHLLPLISPVPDYVGERLTDEEIAELKTGDEIFHMNHGRGKLHQINKSGKFRMANIEFDSGARVIILAASDLLKKIKE